MKSKLIYVLLNWINVLQNETDTVVLKKLNFQETFLLNGKLPLGKLYIEMFCLLSKLNLNLDKQ